MEMSEEQRSQREGSVSDGVDGQDGNRVRMTESVRLSPVKSTKTRVILAARQDVQSLLSLGLSVDLIENRRSSALDSEKLIQIQKKHSPQEAVQSWL